jgi:hypothetical protein
VKVRLEGSNVRSIYANVAGIEARPEGFLFLFGINRPATLAGLDRQEMAVKVLDRIILPPAVAKQLLGALKTVINDYESRYGFLEVEPGQSTGQEDQPSSGREPPSGRAERGGEYAHSLEQLIGSLSIKYGLERSFKIFHGTLLTNRFLLTVHKRSLVQKPEERILDICERMGMPPDLMEPFRARLPEANLVHFGFEGGETACIYKVYLEFRDRGGSKPFLLHLAFKWDPTGGTTRAVTAYTCHPSLSLEIILQRVATILDDDRHREAVDTAKGILISASAGAPEKGIRYLEVSEEGNPRRSFDINLYKAGLPLEHFYPFLSDLCRHYAIPLEQFQSLYDTIRIKTLGHLSGGIDREGKDFFTVYFGVEGR